jgi:TorA maturation chaperone TorD
MAKYTHEFAETYDGLVGFGFDRQTDENTVICYLQMFSDDTLMKKLVNKLADDELEEIFSMISRLLRNHLSESDYHKLFLKEDHT